MISPVEGAGPRKSGVPVATTFRLRLQQWMKSHKGVSERELARHAGISHVHLQHIRKGKAMPTLPVAEQIARAMGCNLADLI